MRYSVAALAAAIALPCATASGAIFFTFQDPSPQRELTVTENLDSSLSFSYSMSQFVSLSVMSDAGELANTTFNQTRLTLDLTTSTTPIVDQPDLLVTEISGTFMFEDMSGMAPSTILTGSFSDAITTLIRGQFMGLIEASGSVSGDTVVGSVELSEGDALSALLAPGAFLAGRQTASFPLSDLIEQTLRGIDEPFTLVGNAAFTGSSQVIPTPGAAALFGLGGLGLLRRRR